MKTYKTNGIFAQYNPLRASGKQEAAELLGFFFAREAIRRHEERVKDMIEAPSNPFYFDEFITEEIKKIRAEFIESLEEIK